MKLEARSVFAGLWLLLAVSMAFYTSSVLIDTALDISAFYGEERVLAVGLLGFMAAGYCLLIALVYWYSPRLDRTVLSWLHFSGTVAVVAMAWYVLGLALNGGLPGQAYRTSSEIAEEIAHQQAQVLVMQVRALIFLFLASQLMFVINLLTVSKDTEEKEIDRMIDQLLDQE